MVHLLEAGVLLTTGVTTLIRLVAGVRSTENARLHALLAQRTPAETAIALRGLLQVPEGKRASRCR